MLGSPRLAQGTFLILFTLIVWKAAVLITCGDVGLRGDDVDKVGTATTLSGLEWLSQSKTTSKDRSSLSNLMKSLRKREGEKDDPRLGRRRRRREPSIVDLGKFDPDAPDYRSEDATDPLRDDQFLAGFPDRPITIDDGDICNPKLNIQFRDMWKCEKDPTCRECYKGSITKFERLQLAFQNEETRSKRFEALKRKFGVAGMNNVTKQVVIVSAVNYGQIYLFLNWVCSCERIGLNPRRFTVVVPTDDQAKEVLQRTGFFYIETDWLAKLSTPIDARYTGDANTKGHADINNVILMVSNQILQELRHDILLHDVDIAWLKPQVLDYLKLACQRRDMIGMFAPFYVTKGGMNTGFVFLRNTMKTRIFLQSMENIAPLKETSDQELFNILLRHYKMQQLEYRFLSLDIFYKYNGRQYKPPGPDALVYHAVGIHKRSSFMLHKVWFFTEECTVYDKDIDDFSQKTVKEQFNPP